MVAYNLAISIVPFAIFALWLAARIAGSAEFEEAITRDLAAIFPGPTDQTLNSLLARVRSGSAEIGIAALLISIWTGMSFWGSIDTAFGRMYRLPKRGWVSQKKFSFAMLWLVVLFMAATVGVPVAQSALSGVRENLPFGLADVPGATLVTSLGVGLVLLFLTLWAIYALGPNGRLPWRAVWPGALFSTFAIAITDAIFPWYLNNVNAVWHLGTTLVFLVIVLGWFYFIALIILLGAELNAWRLERQNLTSNEADQESRSEAISLKQAM